MHVDTRARVCVCVCVCVQECITKVDVKGLSP